MSELFHRYKGVIWFLTVFLGSYVFFSFLYYLYLENSAYSQYYPDFFTHLVALQSSSVVSIFGYETQLAASTVIPAMDLYLDDLLVARIIEGCNSLSVIILFMAFMLAFFGRLKQTLLFIFSGVVIIYAMNLVRIALLTIGLHEVPQYGQFLHEIAFPLVIYGTVFLLWVLWIRIYSKQQSVRI